MRRRRDALVVVLVLLLPVGRVLSDPAPVTFSKIAPIIYTHCSSCHRAGQPAPFSLQTYAEVREHAEQIAAATKTRVMPPWPPEPGYGDFTHPRRLTDAQIALVQQWVANGAPEGDPDAMPAPPSWPDEWALGRPDLILQLPHPYTLPADGGDVFRSFAIPLPIASRQYVKGVEFRPTNGRLVHHAVIRFDRTGTARRLDEGDAQPGFDGMIDGADDSPQGRFLGWTPGKTPAMEPEGMAWTLDPYADAVIHTHLMPTGKPETLQFQVGFYFSDAAPVDEPMMLRLGSELIDIEPGEKDYPVNARYTLPADVEVLSVYPHAHYLAKEMKAFAILPDGTIRWLIWIKDWNFNWQDMYTYERPVFLPRGTLLSMRYTFDNSGGRGHRSHGPPRRVVYGPRSTDEMADLWLQVRPRNASDAAILQRDRVR